MPTWSTSNKWLICPRPQPRAQLRLFCFPYAGGGASIYRAWADLLPAEIELCAVQLPGRENRLAEPCLTDARSIVAELAPALMPHLTTSFAFFGHSMGALLSFELTRLLRSQYGIEPLHLLVSGRPAPQYGHRHIPIYNLPEPEFLNRLRELEGTPDEALQNAELMEVLIPILRADFAVSETYTYSEEPPLSCPISAFGGLSDADVSRESLAAWADQTSGLFKLRMFPGNHFFIHQVRHTLIAAVAEDLLGSQHYLNGAVR